LIALGAAGTLRPAPAVLEDITDAWFCRRSPPV